jgi:hypothetical protein
MSQMLSPFPSGQPPPRLPKIAAPRPQQWKGVICPIGAIEPPHVGAFFFDKQNGLFYRADGPTAHDWGLVTPAEFKLAFVLGFVDFQAPAHHAMTKAEQDAAANAVPDPASRPPHILQDGRLAELGLRIRDARHWRAGRIQAMQARVKIETGERVSLFVGFRGPVVDPTKPPAVAPDPAAPIIYDASAAGVLFEDGYARAIAGGAASDVLAWIDFSQRYSAVRVEVAGHLARVVLDDSDLAAMELPPGAPLEPHAAFFNYGRWR